MIEFRRKVKAENKPWRKIPIKTEQLIAFDYFNLDMTPTELGQKYKMNQKAIISMLTHWEITPKVNRVAIMVNEKDLHKMKEKGIDFEILGSNTEITQYFESKINN